MKIIDNNKTQITMDRKIQDYSAAIRQLLAAIDRGVRYKRWIRNQLRKRGFVYKAYTEAQDRKRRKEFKRELVNEQKLISQFRKAIKVLNKTTLSL